MDRINQILEHPLYKKYMAANAVKEKGRIFCRHNMNHCLDVARIAYILNAEENHGVSRDSIYAAALLHDIGRHVQYETGEKHAFASARMAPDILQECGFVEEETESIVDAIYHHSDKSEIGKRGLRGLMAKADQMSRACHSCQAAEDCKWSEERKNHKIEW